MNIITSAEFDAYWKNIEEKKNAADDGETLSRVQNIIDEVRSRGDAAVREFAAKFDRSSPEIFEVPPEKSDKALQKLEKECPDLAAALTLAADHIARFAAQQKAPFVDFEYEVAPGIIAGQRVIPVQRAAIYAPAGRFPLISSVLMGIIPARVAGAEELMLASPPLEDGCPDWRILAAARIAERAALSVNNCGAEKPLARVFAIGGAQAVAALALGTETVPRADVIAGAGNRYVAAAKRLLSGEVGIDLIAGPTDVLIIAGDGAASVGSADVIAADMLAQAEHDPDARARALVPSREAAVLLSSTLEKRLAALPNGSVAKASLDTAGLIVIYDSEDDAVRIANTVAPEHLELQCLDETNQRLVPRLKNYGALFIGEASAEVLGDYSAGTNHTLPTAGTARFTGGLSVRHFLKTVTTLRCSDSESYAETVKAAKIIAQAEGLAAHAESAGLRIS